MSSGDFEQRQAALNQLNYLLQEAARLKALLDTDFPQLPHDQLSSRPNIQRSSDMPPSGLPHYEEASQSVMVSRSPPNGNEILNSSFDSTASGSSGNLSTSPNVPHPSALQSAFKEGFRRSQLREESLEQMEILASQCVRENELAVRVKEAARRAFESFFQEGATEMHSTFRKTHFIHAVK